MTVARINDSAKRIGKMVRTTETKIREVPLLPTKETYPAEDKGSVFTSSSGAVITTSDGSRIMVLSGREKQPELDMNKVSALMQRMSEAVDSGSADHSESSSQRVSSKYGSSAAAGSKARKPIKRMASAAESNEALLEKRLVAAIRSANTTRIEDTQRSDLNTRQLLPFYKLDDVHHFIEIFQKVDEDYSGDLDVEEWCNFFLALDKNVSRKQARTIFNHLNPSGSGCLTVTDLLPVVFSNANKVMMALIAKHVEQELSRRKVKGSNFLTESDLTALFEYYDVDAVGFVEARFLREKIRTFQMSDSIYFSIIDGLRGVGDDEMVNEHYFVRMFREYCM
jgi:Ca2+-binding EF-hand superfamily protein